ncbi:MAG: acyltransferase family protein [Solirubrobacterales bacterium]|nr:acyltransferase family protein [Solirubrobacterales bacterium]MCO5316687.1 acyltransferase family protein [Solirubrobacterales bacterium]HRV60760.1 lysophospholipid acyltransferase family protein [Solirubrobacterales bacterium]
MSEARHQGLGGGKLGADSPLFGGPGDELNGNGAAHGTVRDPDEAPAWDPHQDDFADDFADSREAAAEEANRAAEELLKLVDLRDLLPASEPDRALDDWGRSETVVSLMEPILNFYYRYWFRVEVEGIENIPSEGGALIVSNHSGALPPDAPMIMQAIRNEHPAPRPLYMLGEHWFKGYPGVSMLVNKMGLVPAHRENAQRLLHDEGRLAVVFPEGQKGTRKVYWQRYHLRRFGRGGFVRTAIRARVPIVPTAVIGAEESAPIFAHFKLLQKLSGLIYFPLTPSFPHFGLIAPLMYLPSKFKIRFMEPVDMAEYPVETIDDPAEIQVISERLRARIQHQLDDMLAARESVWTG